MHGTPPILVVGIAAVDVVARTVDTYPGPGELRLFDALTVAPGGCAVNVALALARLGTPCDVVAPVGRDAFGDLLAEEIEEAGLRARHLHRAPSERTPFTFVGVRADGERSFLHHPGANRTFRRSDVPEELLLGRHFVAVSGAMVMDALDGEPTADLLAAARRHGASTLLDTVYDDSAEPKEWRRRLLPALPHLDWFVPSEPEARRLSGRRDPAEAARWFQGHGAREVVVKLGARGALCLARDGTAEVVAGVPGGRVVDATGAGDAWCAGFLCGLLDGLEPGAATRRGHAVARFCVQAPGSTAGIPDLAVIRRQERAAPAGGG